MPLGERIEESPLVEVLENGTVLVEYGPMRMWIHVSENGRPLAHLAKEGAYQAIEVLGDLARFQTIIKTRAETLEIKRDYPEIVKRMINATKMMEEPDLTPLSAVAGTASEVVADFISERGGTKIIVENGGDIAIRLKEGERARVGVKTEVDSKKPSYFISVDSNAGIGGIATSGLGGRSFTKGIASGVTILSEKASIADATATVVGNFTNVEDSNIERALAETIYPDTDIRGEWVTLKVGRLSQGKIEEALKRGLTRAEKICQKGLIKGALIAVQGKVVWTDSINSWLTKL